MANYEGFKSRRSVPSFFTTMTPEMRAGDFSAFTVTSTPVDKDQFTGRIDFNENANSQWFGRYC